MIDTTCPNKIVAVIPAFNEDNTIYSVVSGVKQHLANVVVVDDGSSDNTAKFAEEAGAIVLRHNINKGKGASLRTGFNYALANRADFVITLDSDGQHNPSDLEKFIEIIPKTDADIIIGSRPRHNGLMPPIRKLTNSASSGLVSLLSGCRISDVHSGYKCIRTNVLRSIYIECDRFDADIELLIKAINSGSILKEIPVETVYENSNSKIKPLSDTIRYFKTIIKEHFLSAIL